MERVTPPAHKKSILSWLWVCLSSCGLTLLILAAVYALRGIWPFGADNIAYVDTAQYYLPGYYRLWDALHGATRNISWFSGLAETSNAGWADLLNPINWIFLLVARDHILEGLSLFLGAYLVFISLTTSLVLCLRFPRLSGLQKVLLTLAYTFSGFVLQYYANFFWLRIVAVFPILLFCLELLLRKGKWLPYFLVYCYYLTGSMYYTYMSTIYILLFSLGYCLFVLPRENRGDRILRLGLSTVAAYGVTAWYWMSSVSSITGTSRFQSNVDTGLMTGFTTWNIANTRHTVLMLLGMAFVMALMIRALLRQRTAGAEEKKRRSGAIRLFLFLFVMLAIPMVFTNIDTAWHFGQYNFFPMRYGYMLPATLVAAAALCLEEENVLPAGGRCQWAAWVDGIVCAAALAFLLPRLWPILQEYGACFLTALGTSGYWRYFALLAACGLLFTGLYLALLHLKNRSVAFLLMAVVLVLQMGSNAYGLLAPNDDHVFTYEYDPAYVDAADSLYEYVAEQNIPPLSRFKNVDNSLSVSYPAVAGVSSVSSVRSSNSNLKLGVFQELGYTVNYFRILDTGGTVFSDMLFGVEHVLSAEELDPSLYTDTGVQVAGTRIGNANYPGLIGLTYTDGALDEYPEILTLDGRLNALYQAFTGSDRNLAYVPETTFAGEGMNYTITLTLEEESFLYFSSGEVLMNITVNGTPLTVPSYLNTKNTVYPAEFNANLLYAGCFEAGEVTIQLMSPLALTEESFAPVALKKSLVETFYTDASYDENTSVFLEGDTICMTLSSSGEDGMLFLPVVYRSWDCTVNGQQVSPEPVMGVLTAVPLQDGENEITLTVPSAHFRLTRGAVISLVSLVLAAAVWFFFLRPKAKVAFITIPAWVYTTAMILFYAVCAAVIAFLYLVPTICLLTQGTIVRF